jgi:hypothetical protein
MKLGSRISPSVSVKAKAGNVFAASWLSVALTALIAVIDANRARTSLGARPPKAESERARGIWGRHLA